MVRILGLKQRFAPRYAAMRQAAALARPSAASRGKCPPPVARATAADVEGDDDDGTSEDFAATTALDQEDGEDGGSGIGGSRAAGAAAGSVSDDVAGSAAAGSGSEGANNAVGGESSSEHPRSQQPGGGAKGKGQGRIAFAVASAGALDGTLSAGKAEPGVVGLRKRLRESLVPDSELGTTWTMVRHELTERGGFQPLMQFFPGVRDHKDGSAVGAIPWGSRDREMPSIMGKMARQANRQKANRLEKSPQNAAERLL